MTKSATSHLLPVFARVDLGFERGEGAWLIATNGERYLDFTSGVAVNALGHAHPHLVAALQEQATKLWHMSNLFKSPDGDRLAARLCEQSFADFVFFCNSGAEAMECAIKVTRRYHFAKGHPERYRIITFDSAFHGRTLGTLAATGSAKYLEGFGPPIGRLRPGHAGRSRRCQEGDRAADRRHPDRAAAGRRRRARRTASILPGICASSATNTACC